jgi:hypothetical protein
MFVNFFIFSLTQIPFSQESMIQMLTQFQVQPTRAHLMFYVAEMLTLGQRK